jgi:hypothetical protein
MLFSLYSVIVKSGESPSRTVTSRAISLPQVWVFWLAVVAALYFPCAAFARYKELHHDWWLSLGATAKCVGTLVQRAHRTEHLVDRLEHGLRVVELDVLTAHAVVEKLARIRRKAQPRALR